MPELSPTMHNHIYVGVRYYNYAINYHVVDEKLLLYLRTY